MGALCGEAGGQAAGTEATMRISGVGESVECLLRETRVWVGIAWVVMGWWWLELGTCTQRRDVLLELVDPGHVHDA